MTGHLEVSHAGPVLRYLGQQSSSCPWYIPQFLEVATAHLIEEGVEAQRTSGFFPYRKEAYSEASVLPLHHD